MTFNLRANPRFSVDSAFSVLIITPFEPQAIACYHSSIMMNSYNNYSWWGPAPFAGFGVLGVLGVTLLAILLIVEIALKGYALWYAARRSEKWWFIAILIINTAGILEIVYLVFFVKKWHRKFAKKDQAPQ